MGLAAVVFKEHTRRAVQLAYDDTLGSVNNERAGLGHQRHLTHVGLVLTRLFNGGLCGLSVHNHEPNTGTQRCRIGQASLLALFDVKGRLAELKVNKLELGITVVANNRKDGAKGSLQAVVLALIGRDLSL